MRWPWSKPKRAPEIETFEVMLTTSAKTSWHDSYLEANLAWDRFFRDLQEQSERAARRQHYRKVVRPRIHRAAVRQA